MPFSRAIEPRLQAEGDLTRAMVGIGMAFAAKAAPDPNIEDTVLAASIDGMEHDDLRVLAVLTTWLGVHAPWLNADRLTRIVGSQGSQRVRAYWSAIAAGQSKDSRFRRLATMYDGPRIDLLAVGTEFQVRRRGEDVRFEGTALRVPSGTLRDRPGDILMPSELAARHLAYYYRVLIGPSYRADMWAALDREPDLTAAELARRTYGSFATAWHVKRDFELLRNVAHAGRSRPNQ